jgi:hypothetical protein
MDALSLIIRTISGTLESTGVPPDALQDALVSAERSLRRSLGGGHHHISRLPSTKIRIVDLAEQGLTPRQISARLGITDRYARQVLGPQRAGTNPPPEFRKIRHPTE